MPDAEINGTLRARRRWKSAVPCKGRTGRPGGQHDVRFGENSGCLHFAVPLAAANCPQTAGDTEFLMSRMYCAAGTTARRMPFAQRKTFHRAVQFSSGSALSAPRPAGMVCSLVMRLLLPDTFFACLGTCTLLARPRAPPKPAPPAGDGKSAQISGHPSQRFTRWPGPEVPCSGLLARELTEFLGRGQ